LSLSQDVIQRGFGTTSLRWIFEGNMVGTVTWESGDYRLQKGFLKAGQLNIAMGDSGKSAISGGGDS
jgi:hypothetical protein